MNKQDCFYLGKIVSKFSFKGEVLLKLDSDEIDFKKLKTIFLEIDGAIVPYSIDNIKLHKSSLLRIRFENIDNEEKANKIIKIKTYLPIKDLPKLNGNKFYYHEITNFMVLDLTLGEIGKVLKVNDQTSQPIIVVINNNSEIMIPLVDDFLIDINRDKKTLTFNLPEGLTTL
ncbi:MAG: 16S rRNA processing protein RimM [Flavobacteriaceae bacterium]|jgi:16S rRNA processing protein RimM|nr:16S rRNA processing protein RimM [Flavobacteriaceae bacterium]MBT4298311.1 16S rRNA processing protein RimM [Flavobacteriaceae bacterium]MDA9826788.1 ribosome maturation factor RimM [Flavobacteriaceae bacterium]